MAANGRYGGVYEAGTSPFVCRHGTHVGGAVSKLVHTKRIDALKCVVHVLDTVCMNGAHDSKTGL